jgi:hypothetical protein
MALLMQQHLLVGTSTACTVQHARLHGAACSAINVAGCKLQGYSCDVQV